MSMFVVGLAGPAQVGKSTTMRALETMFLTQQIPIDQRSFAGPLYEAISAITGRDVAELKATKDIPWTAADGPNPAPMPCLLGWTPRKMLQHVGEFMRSSVSEKLWIERAMVPFTWPSFRGPQIVIFDDARHVPEFDVCHVVVELERDGCEYACNHPSAMPPDATHVDLKIRLDRDPMEIGRVLKDFILNRYSARLKAATG